MTPDRIRMAAELLVEARDQHRQLDDMPDSCRPSAATDAYAIQDAVADRLGPIAGWKTGAPSSDAEPIAAPMPESAVFRSAASVSASGLHRIGIEAELAYRFGRDLPARATDYAEADIVAAVASVHPAIEIVDSRFRDKEAAGALWRLADNQSNGGFVYGDGVTDWQRIEPMRQPVTLTFDGSVVAEAVGGNPAGDPLRLLTWLANHCARRCGGLRSGDIVTTGSCTGLIEARPGSRVIASFPGLGEACVEFPA